MNVKPKLNSALMEVLSAGLTWGPDLQLKRAVVKIKRVTPHDRGITLLILRQCVRGVTPNAF
jgi:hypothetical protein